MLCTWIVVADSSRARFFSMKNRLDPLTEIQCMSHLESRGHAYDDFDEYHGSLGQGDHTFETHSDLKQSEADVFAKQIADRLEQGRVKHEFNNLILVAPPAFLGALRHGINDHVFDYISNSVDKNLVVEREEVIRHHLF
ncbi:MAG: host attachment protein [Methylomonas lenta]|nr:host attachment protein [Methylomonas lenta]